ncbi:hypothetical protein [Micromonospora sp. NPDC023814]|uniref:hypothetical protein n=1 Tax=Micromonospora sp. NPDC023814 TaxID=3154596 RepID=UPI0033ECE26D
MGHWVKNGGGDIVYWKWEETGDAPPGGEWGYSYEALTNPYHLPQNYQPLPSLGSDVPPDVEISKFTFNDDWLSNLTGTLPPPEVTPPPQSTSPEDPPPVLNAFHILPSTIRDAEHWIKQPLRDTITGQDGWNELKAYIDGVKDWIFYRPEHLQLPDDSYNKLYPTDETRHEAPSAEALAMVNYIDNLMAGGSDALMTVAVFLDRLDTAGQIYVAADKQSYFPAA